MALSTLGIAGRIGVSRPSPSAASRHARDHSVSSSTLPQWANGPKALRHDRCRRAAGNLLNCWREAWKDAVRRAVADSGCVAMSGRFAVELEFRLGEARRVSEVWDLDNLIKPTLDAMEGVFGLRPWGGAPQPADDQVDEIRATKREPLPGETPGARIDVWLIEADDPV